MLRVMRDANTLLTASEVARKCNVPTMRIQRAVEAGRIEPDYRTSHFQLFNPSRLAELRDALQRKA